MNLVSEQHPEGTELARQGEVCPRALLLREGQVRLYRTFGDGDEAYEVSLALLGPGDVLSAECLFNDPPLHYSAIALTDIEGVAITRGALNAVLDEDVPDWMRSLVHSCFRRQRASERPERSSLGNLYGITSLLLTYIRMRSDESEYLFSPLSPILDELINILPLTRGYIQPVLEGLSHVGLIDLKTSDPYNQSVAIPQPALLVGFLHFLQRTADLHSGVIPGGATLPRFEINPRTERLLDNLLTDERFSERMVSPQRGILHVRSETLAELERVMTGTQGIEKGKTLNELEELGVLKKVMDGNAASYFLDLRSALRLNILRNPRVNFIDIIDYLLERMYQVRFEEPHEPPLKGD